MSVAAQLLAHRTSRFYPENSGPDQRQPFQRDRDRILYTSALQRLAEVTQVISAEEGHVFHNRLTHSLKVAQVARRIAEWLLREQPRLAEKAGVDPDVAEAAALAHDLGHPPFGHLAEEELDKAIVAAGLPDGYEGNAQSFRILTKLALKSADYEGLNLTRATLAAVLKYPWPRRENGAQHEKWGAYTTELQPFRWAREGVAGEDVRTVEAEIMDWADDVTYAVHDVSDFYAAGRIPLEAIGSARDRSERRRFLSAVFDRVGDTLEGFERADLENSFEKLIQYIGFAGQYRGTRIERAALQSACSNRIGTYVRSLSLQEVGGAVQVSILPESRKQVAMLKQLTWHYIILDSRTTTERTGQRRLIRELFAIYQEALEKQGFDVFPAPYTEMLEKGEAPVRVIADYIAGMTEREALTLYLRLGGVPPHL